MDGVFTASWSPNGDKLAFVGNEGGASDIYLYDLVSKKLSNLTDDVFSDSEPSWNSDGTQIVFVSDRDKIIDIMRSSIWMNEHNKDSTFLSIPTTLKLALKEWNENFDKLINSKNADMQNINYVGGAGSTTAAQFLQRFIINKTPWAHLDIAGMAFSKYAGALNSGGATGYGVRLLNKFVEENYE